MYRNLHGRPGGQRGSKLNRAKTRIVPDAVS